MSIKIRKRKSVRFFFFCEKGLGFFFGTTSVGQQLVGESAGIDPGRCGVPPHTHIVLHTHNIHTTEEGGGGRRACVPPAVALVAYAAL